MQMIHVKLVLMSLLWAGSFVGGRMAMSSLEPFHAATIRYAVASAALVIVLWRLERVPLRLSTRQLLATFGLGATGVYLYNYFFFQALANMPASRTALFVAINPVVVTLASAALFKERLRPVQWAGIIIALVGALLVISRGAPMALIRDTAATFGTGELMMLGAVVSWVAYTLIGRLALRDLTPVAATTYASLWGLLLLALSLAATTAPQSWLALSGREWLLSLYLGIGGTVVPFVWYAQGIQQLGPSRCVVYTNLVPLFGVLLGVLLLSEYLHFSMILGGALVLAGVSQTNRR